MTDKMSETRLFAAEQRCLHRYSPTTLCCGLPYGHGGQHQYPGVQSLSTHRDEEGALRTPDGARVYEPPTPEEKPMTPLVKQDARPPWNQTWFTPDSLEEKTVSTLVDYTCGNETGDGTWVCNKTVGHPGLHGQKRGEGGGFAATWGDDHVAGGKPTLCMNTEEIERQVAQMAATAEIKRERGAHRVRRDTRRPVRPN